MPFLAVGFDTSGAVQSAAAFNRGADSMSQSARALENLVDKLGTTTRRTGREQLTAAEKAKTYTRQQQLVAKIVRQTGVSVASASRAVRLFGRDLDRAEREARDFAVSMDVAAQAVRELRQAQRSSEKGSSFFVRQFKATAAGVLSAAAAMAVLRKSFNFVGEAREASLALDAVERSLKAARGDADLAANDFAFLRAEVDRLGLVLGPAADNFSLITAAARGTRSEGQGVRDLFTSLAGTSAVLSLSSESLSRAFLQLSQGIAKNKFDLEDLKIVFEQIPGSADAMARGLNVTKAEMFAMQSAGKLLAEDAIPALVKGLNDAFGGQVAEAIKSDRAELNRFTTALFDAKAAAGDAVLPVLVDLAKATTEALKEYTNFTRQLQDSPAIMAAVGIAIQSMITKLEFWLKLLATTPRLVSTAFAVWISSIQGPIEALQKLLKVMAAVADAVPGFGGAAFAKGADKAAEALGGVNAVLGTIQTELVALAATPSGLPEIGAEAGNAGAALDTTRKSVQGAREELESSIQHWREVLRLMDETGGTSDQVSAALKLMAEGFRGTFEEALHLTQQLELLKNVASTLDRTRVLIQLPLDLDPRIDPNQIVPDPEPVDTEGFKEATLELDGIVASLEHLSGIFGRIGGKFGDLLSRIFSVVSQIVSLASGTSGSAGDTLSQFGTVGEALRVFTAVYDIAEQLIEESRLRDFDTPLEVGRSGGTRTGLAAVGHRAAIDQNQGLRLVREMQAAIDSIELAIGSLIIDMDTIGIQFRNDGEQIQLLIEGVVFGVFQTFEEAFEEGLAIALRDATFAEQIGENLAQVLSRAPGLGMEAIVGLIPTLAKLDGATQGLTDSQSLALLAARRRTTALDQEVSLLIRAGVETEQVLALRERELDAMQRENDLRGLSLLGINTQIDALREYQDQELALATAREEAAARIEQVVEAAEATASTLATGPGGLGPGSGPGGSSGGLTGPGGGRLDELGSRLTGFAGSVGVMGQEVGDVTVQIEGVTIALKGARSAAEETETATENLESTLADTVTTVVRLNSLQDFYGQLVNFQEQFGVEIAGNQMLQQQMARMEFEVQRLRLIQLAHELAINQEILGLSNAQVQQLQAWAATLQDVEFTGIRTGGGRGGQRRQERQQAAEEWERLIQQTQDALDGVSSAQRQYLEQLERAHEIFAMGAISAEQLSEGLSAIAALQAQQAAAPFRESLLQADETDTATTARHAAEAMQRALADALVAAGENPTAYEEAARAIRDGFAASMEELGRDALSDLGGVTAEIGRTTADTVAQIRFLLNNLDQLGLTADQVAMAVRQGVMPALLDMIIAQAERTGNEELAERVRQRRARFELQIARIQFEAAVATLRALGPLPPAIADIVDEARGLFDLADADVDGPGAELSLTLNGLISDIGSLAQAAGIELPVEMAHAWAQAQFQLAKAELMTALATEQAAAIFAEAGLSIGEAVAFVANLEFPDLEQAPATPRGGGRFPVDRNPNSRSRRDEGESLADIIDELRRGAQSPMERLVQEYQDMMDRIAEATGTAAERALAAQLAEEAFAKARMKLVEDAWQQVRDLISDTTSSGVLGVSPEQQRQRLMAEVQSLAARAIAGDLDAASQLGQRGGELIALIEELYGGGREGAALAAQVIALLSQAEAAAGPTSLGASPPPGALAPPPGLPPITPTVGQQIQIQQFQSQADLTQVVNALVEQHNQDRQQMSSLTTLKLQRDALRTDQTVTAIQSLSAAPLASGRGA